MAKRAMRWFVYPRLAREVDAAIIIYRCKILSHRRRQWRGKPAVNRTRSRERATRYRVSIALDSIWIYLPPIRLARDFEYVRCATWKLIETRSTCPSKIPLIVQGLPRQRPIARLADWIALEITVTARPRDRWVILAYNNLKWALTYRF